MTFICWLLAGLITASLFTLLLSRKGYPAVGLLYIITTGMSVLSGWWATQLGWEWGDAIVFNYRSVLVALAGGILVAPIITLVLNFLYPATELRDIPVNG